MNAGYSHTFTYCYDAVNRLTHAVASGSPAYDLMYSYDQYGNGTCVPGSGGGLCPAMSYDSSTNHLTSIGSTAIGYDPAGNQLNDIWSTYEYDAEGRVTHSYSSGQWQYPTYNALGQRVQDYQGTDPMTLSYPIDIFGQRTGTFAQWPSQGWTGWNVYWSQIAGQRLNMGGASAYVDHSDVVGSTTMETDPAGAVQWDVTHYPLGGVFQEQGIRQSEVVMGLDWQVNDPLVPSATREVSTALGRWTTPDALGGDVTNPQSLNRYGYALNNPATLTDPLGLASHCHKELVGWSGEGTWKVICDDPDSITVNGNSPGVDLVRSPNPDLPGGGNGQETGGAGGQAQSSPSQPSKTAERIQRLKNCALGYYGIDPLSVTGLSSDAKWALIVAAAGGVPKSVAAKFGVRVIMLPGSSRFTSLLSIISAESGGGPLRGLANFGSKWAGPIAIASSVIDATAIGICTASD